MALHKQRKRAAIVTCGFVLLQLALAFPPAQGRLSRLRRQVCEEYKHETWSCCKCGAGYKWKKHCSDKDRNDGECDPCEDGTYNSVANVRDKCEPCKSCSQPSANLEVDIPCSRTKDTVCKCKDQHYCIGDTQPCTHCSPCKVCDPDVGVKVSCSGGNNTVCNEKAEGSKTGIIWGVTAPVLLVLVAVVIVCIWRKWKKKGSRTLSPTQPSNDVVLQEPLMELGTLIDLMPHIPDLAPVIGWTEMRNIAMRCNVPNSIIEDFQKDHSNDGQERTICLMKYWVEKEGMGASNILINSLQDKKGKAEKVMKILGVNTSTSSHPDSA